MSSMQFSLQTDPYRYDNEIDRMLWDLRVRRQEKNRSSHLRPIRSARSASHKKHETDRLPRDDEWLFTSELERQRAARAALRDSFLELENFSAEPQASAAEVDDVAGENSGEEWGKEGEKENEREREKENEGEREKENEREREKENEGRREKERSGEKGARGRQSAELRLSFADAADAAAQLQAMRAQQQADAAVMDSLRRKLRAAKNENDLMRREMYGSIVKIGKHLERLRGDGDLFEKLEGVDDDMGNSSGTRRPTVFFNAEEVDIIENIEGVIATCAKRLQDIKMLYGDEDS